METKKSTGVENYLTNKIIEVKPIVRESNWLGKGHDGEFMFTDTEFSTQLPIDRVSGQLVRIMDRDEQLAFEKELNLEEGDMSFYNRNSPFWSKLRVRLTKEGKKLDLSKPYDYIYFKVLQKDKRIAPSWSERHSSGEYKFALVDPEEEVKTNVSKTDYTLEAYKIFAKIADNAERMQDILKVYGLKTKSNKTDFLKVEIQKLIDKDAKEFVNVYSDPNLNTKIMIEKALEIGALERTSTKAYKIKGTEDADAIGDNLTETIAFLNNKKNSDIFLRIKTQIDESKK